MDPDQLASHKPADQDPQLSYRPADQDPQLSTLTGSALFL